MSIMWKYLDKRSATIAAIKDYESMQFIIKHTDDEIRAERDKMSAVRSPGWDGMPHAHNPNAQEERILNGIEEIDILKERYRQAVEYMDWFKPAWDQLTEDEKYVLETFYGDANSYGSNAVYYIAEYFKIEQTSAYKRKNRALDRLTVLLFGRQ
ncbi:hypothetical protein [Chordicoccus furentiruminis]|uniref:hypothetical protein n=1 Tax=Chordicoccus furentiruminis TaxID=2709410 RepID=UPI0023A8BD4C|nr:hypothetical protein [Chordicoccus furentiruminis]